MKKFFLLILLAFMLSCNFIERDSIKLDSSKMNLPVDLEQEDDVVSFYDLFDNIKLIKLETNDKSLISNVDKIVFHKDTIFILDRKMKSLFLFDYDGKYINTLRQYGQGPGQYSEITDFIINDYTNQIEVLSVHKGILCYDMNLNFLHKIDFPSNGFLAHSFASLDSINKVFYNLIKPNNLEIWDMKRKVKLGGYLNIPDYVYRKSVIGGPYSLKSVSQGRVHLKQSFSNIVYEVTKDSFCIGYKWDFGKFNFSIDELDEGLSEQEYDRILNSVSFLNSRVSSFLCLESNEYLYLSQFSYGEERVIKNVLYNVKTNTYKKFSKLKEGVLFPYYSNIIGDSVFSICRDTLVANKYLSEEMKNDYDISYNGLDEDSNPLILVYKLRGTNL